MASKKHYQEKFPRSFLWGTVTSGHQVEGNNVYSDWWKWEKENPEIEESGIACDHYHKYRQDLKLAKKVLHNNAYRFSIEWARIEPRKGKFDKKEIEHYRRVLKELKRLKMKSMVTLHHFVNPLWFSEAGGWKEGDNIKYFVRYAKLIRDKLGNFVDYWAPINEPNVYASHAYLYGKWPPQEKNILSTIKVYMNMAKAHRAVFKEIHKKYPNSEVLPVVAMNSFVTENIIKKTISGFLDLIANQSFLILLKGDYDFIGINYYGPFETKIIKFSKGLDIVESMNWKIYPRGMYEVVMRVWRKYGKPVMITENGNADADDKRRQEYIHNHLYWLKKAIDKGADVKGYFYWSLMDNFEWHLGKSIKFGLLEIDYKTLKRKPRTSARLYGRIAKNNSLPKNFPIEG